MTLRTYEIVLRHTEYDQNLRPPSGGYGGWREVTKTVRAHDAADALTLALAGLEVPTLGVEGWICRHGWRVQSATAVEDAS